MFSGSKRSCKSFRKNEVKLVEEGWFMNSSMITLNRPDLTEQRGRTGYLNCSLAELASLWDR